MNELSLTVTRIQKKSTSLLRPKSGALRVNPLGRRQRVDRKIRSDVGAQLPS